MQVLRREERQLADRISALAFENPFTPRRVALEREILGPHFVPGPSVWTPSLGSDPGANAARIGDRAESLMRTLRSRLEGGAIISVHDQERFRDLAFYTAFHAYDPCLFDLVKRAETEPQLGVPQYSDFADRLGHDLAWLGASPQEAEPAHYFACMFQIRRAFHHVFHGIVGVSAPAARLRADVWRSIFTCDLRRYVRSTHRHLGELPTLVTGASGSGKELVVRAVALSRYVAFDSRRARFDADFGALFFPLNVSALPTTLVESELFGHRRGAFTGATHDRPGYLEQCPATGTVFLDEIGDLDPVVQVKLLRVLQDRGFQRLGESTPRAFTGKFAAATNRDLGTLLSDGRFRDDLYYRLCADRIETPSLAARLADHPDELGTLIGLLAQRWLGPEEGDILAAQALDFVTTRLPPDYDWPGNVRELEQCLRSVLLRSEYTPPKARGRAPHPLAESVLAGEYTAEELLARYTRHVFALTGTQVATAQRLGLDRRTVAKYVRACDPAHSQ